MIIKSPDLHRRSVFKVAGVEHIVKNIILAI